MNPPVAWKGSPFRLTPPGQTGQLMGVDLSYLPDAAPGILQGALNKVRRGGYLVLGFPSAGASLVFVFGRTDPAAVRETAFTLYRGKGRVMFHGHTLGLALALAPARKAVRALALLDASPGRAAVRELCFARGYGWLRDPFTLLEPLGAGGLP